MLVNQHVYGVAAAHAPVLHLRRDGESEIFATYLSSFERVWAAATPLAVTPDGLQSLDSQTTRAATVRGKGERQK